MTIDDPKDSRPKCLVVVLNETRGSSATAEPLVKVGLARINPTLAYCGRVPSHSSNPYAQYGALLWEYDEPVSWLEEFQKILTPQIYAFFFDTSSSTGITTSSRQTELWVSAWIQIVYRLRAIENIISRGLDKMFDWVIFVRSDYLFTSPIRLPPSHLESGLVLMAGESYGGVNDRFLAVPGPLLPAVRDAIDYISVRTKNEESELFGFLTGQQSQNPETVLWFQIKNAGLLGTTYFVGQTGFCVRVEGEGSRWSQGFWSGRRRLFVKYPTEVLLSKWSTTRLMAQLFSSGPRHRAIARRVLFLIAKVVRAAGTQPRLFLAPLLILSGDFKLGREVFLRSERERDRLTSQLLADLREFATDVKSVLLGGRKW